MRQALLLLATLAVGAQAIHIFLDQTTPRCILEDLPAQTVVVGDFSAWIKSGEEWIAPATVGIAIEATEKSSSHIVLSMQAGNTGRFAFTTAESGDHKICFRSNYSSWTWSSEAKTKLYLVLTVGEGNDNSESAFSKERLGDVALQTRGLNNRVTDIRREQQYQKEQEEKFRDTSESVNSRVAWFLILQTLVFMLASAWQLTHLQSFFKAKKVV